MVTIHPHPVALVAKDSDSTNWICDGRRFPGGCKQNCTTFLQTKGWTRYRCERCDFDLCEGCFTANVAHGVYVKCHPHSLLQVNKDNGWSCDGIRLPGGCVKGCNGFNQTRGWVRYNCQTCDFDLCEGCVGKHVQQINVSIHPHPLHQINRDNGWACDGRKLPGGCKRGCSSFHQTWGWSRFQCEACDFDLCEGCMNAYTVVVAAPQPAPAPAPAPAIPSVEQPREIAATPKSTNTIKDDADLKLCIICMEEPKNASIIHGGTGHQVCCIDCARALQAAKKACPICRANIDAVVQNFLV